MKKRFFLLGVLSLIFLFSNSANANFVKDVKKAKKKVEHKLGWDRYILCWGDRFVPPQDRWVAIRSAVPKKKHTMGKFWDVPGKGKKVNGPNKKIQLWDITFQEYPKSDRRYKFISVYDKTGHPDDYGWYLIKSKTGMFVQANGKGKQITLNKGYDPKNRNHNQAGIYQWRVKNVGKNKFTFISRHYGLAIDARGWGKKNGTVVQMWDDGGHAAVQWEFIYIASGDEVKSTKTMAKKRAKEVGKMAKKVADKFDAIANKVSQKVMSKIKKGFNKIDDKLLSVKKKGNNFELSVGFPEQKSLYDELKGKTIDKLFKLDFKKIKFEPAGKDKILVGIINRIECLGHHVDLSLEMTGDWGLSKNGFKINNFVVSRFSLPFLPDKLTKGIRNAISKETKKLKINIKKFPGMNAVASGAGKGAMKVKDYKKGPYGFKATLAI